jgi:uncharacterized Ntn-hydrolase superfamily protein
VTLSIVAYSPEENVWGVAVASKFLAVGSVVSWARAGAGAVATQAFGKVSFGPDGLNLMEQGLSAEEALARVLASDDQADDRQVGMVDAKGGSAAFTGADCIDYAGHIIGVNFACQGNLLTGRVVLESMAASFTQGKDAGSLAWRLTQALRAGDEVGGDRRGKQSAALLVVKAGGGYGGDNDRYIDLRVDDHSDPVNRLAELLELHDLYFGKPGELLPIDTTLATELQMMMQRTGHYKGNISGQWDEDSREAFWELVGEENLEERWSPEEHPESIDSIALTFLRNRFGK